MKTHTTKTSHPDKYSDKKTEYELSIVIPVYNGSESIEFLVTELSKLKIPGGHEILLINDGSADNSAQICRDLVTHASSIPVVFIDMSRNFGEHNAVMAGLKQARGAYVITMDDDLQNPPSEVYRLYEACKNRQHDVVYTFYKEKKHHPLRNLGSWLANKTAGLMLEKPDGLYLSSFRCLNSFTVRNVVRYSGPYPYVDGLITQVTQNIGTLEVEHLPRASGQSGYTLKKLINLWISISINFSILPLRITTMLGILLTIFGFFLTIIVVLDKLTGDTPTGWSSVIAVVLVFSGAQLLMMGVLGEYIGRVFLSINRKPQYIIRSIYESSSEEKE